MRKKRWKSFVTIAIASLIFALSHKPIATVRARGELSSLADSVPVGFCRVDRNTRPDRNIDSVERNVRGTTSRHIP